MYPNSFGLEQIIIENKFCKPKKLKVLANGSSNGIDTSFFDPKLYSHDQNLSLKGKLNILTTDFAFIFVGRLVKDKGINEMVVAFEQLHKENDSVKLILVGDYENDLDPLLPKTLETIKKHESIFISDLYDASFG